MAGFHSILLTNQDIFRFFFLDSTRRQKWYKTVVKFLKCVATYQKFLKTIVYHILIKFKNIYENGNILDFLNWFIDYCLYLKFFDFFVPCLTPG